MNGTRVAMRRDVVATHCPYCAFQCGTEIEVRDGDVRVRGNESFPVNRGALCIKGWTAADTLRHHERLRTPLVRDAQGRLVPVSWDEALARIKTGVARVQAAHGRDAVAIFGGGSLTNEKAYLLGTDLLCVVGSHEEVLEMSGRFLQYYRENAKYLERTYDFVERVGIAALQKILIDDSEGIAARLDAEMQASVDAYVDPWSEADEPAHPTQFASLIPAEALVARRATGGVR